ncbi:MAG: type II toxin-antitoxin system death-on-curing family toxin [Candidatus Limnocylindrales bacterium]
MIRYVLLEDLLRIADLIHAGERQVRDVGLLASAAARPATTVFGEDAYPEFHEKAAALLHSLARNHPLVDGNKRLAWVATRLFYLANERVLEAPEDEAFDLVMAVAEGRMDVPEIAQSLQRWGQ